MVMAEQNLRMCRVRRGLQHTQGGAAKGFCIPPFATKWRCLPAQHPPLSEQIWRMSRARRGFQHPQGGVAR
eukprot:3841277-Pyramimonas_sp.AAC.1